MMWLNKHWQTAVFLAVSILLFAPSAQAQHTVRLEIRLRDSGGTAVSGEGMTLQRLPEASAAPQLCTTNGNGVCTWQVGRGLYQILFERPLDNVSALELAEGGLRGFGLTVGDTPITYHFTLQSNGKIYYDAAPASIIPMPIVPTLDAHHEAAASTPVIELTAAETPGVIELVPVAETAVSIPTQQAHDETAVSNSNPIWHLLVYIAIGLIIGGSIYAWPKAARRATRNKQFQSPIPDPSRRSGQVPQSPSEESNHA